MANSALNQNRLAQMIMQEPNADHPVKLNRRNWLHSAAIKATSAVMLIFVLAGCTKEHWDDVVGKLPDLGGSEPGVWYNLRVTYKDENGATQVGYLAGISNTAQDSFWDYMHIVNSNNGNRLFAGKFKLHQTEDGWAYWEIDDGNWLSLKATGWAYRSFEFNRVEWKIIDGKLCNRFRYLDSDWYINPLGTVYRSLLVYPAYYVGVNLGDDKVLTNCELEPAP